MAKQVVNVGTGGNKGDGDTLRASFTKINSNFTEVYDDIADLKDGVVATNVTGDLTGSVFADDSTLLIDGVNGEIPGYVKIVDLKTALQDGAGDFDAFKSWVLANL